MSERNEAEIQSLAVSTLQQATRRLAIRMLEAPGALGPSHYRQVERLMRLAIALAGAGRGIPSVQIHGIPPTGRPGSDPGALPELLTIRLTDLLAARAADHLSAALEGDAEALRAFEMEAERIIDTENIQLG
jgi:hypothetical protein